MFIVYRLFFEIIVNVTSIIDRPEEYVETNMPYTIGYTMRRFLSLSLSLSLFRFLFHS